MSFLMMAQYFLGLFYKKPFSCLVVKRWKTELLTNYTISFSISLVYNFIESSTCCLLKYSTGNLTKLFRAKRSDSLFTYCSIGIGSIGVETKSFVLRYWFAVHEHTKNHLSEHCNSSFKARRPIDEVGKRFCFHVAPLRSPNGRNIFCMTL